MKVYTQLVQPRLDEGTAREQTTGTRGYHLQVFQVTQLLLGKGPNVSPRLASKFHTRI